MYLEWGRRADERATDDLPFAHREWIALHAEASFVEFVTWIRDDLDAVGPELAPRRQRRVARLFGRTVDLEAAFFDAAYGGTPAESGTPRE